MKKETEFRASRSAENTCELADLAMLTSLLFPPLAILGFGAKCLADSSAKTEIESARNLQAGSESEADEIADRWERNRNSDESSLRVEVESSDGGRAIYTYTTDDVAATVNDTSDSDNDGSESTSEEAAEETESNDDVVADETETTESDSYSDEPAAEESSQDSGDVESDSSAGSSESESGQNDDQANDRLYECVRSSDVWKEFCGKYGDVPDYRPTFRYILPRITVPNDPD